MLLQTGITLFRSKIYLSNPHITKGKNTIASAMKSHNKEWRMKVTHPPYIMAEMKEEK